MYQVNDKEHPKQDDRHKVKSEQYEESNRHNYRIDIWSNKYQDHDNSEEDHKIHKRPYSSDTQ